MLRNFILSPKDFDVDKSKRLGHGMYGDVFEGTDKRTAPPMPVAVKVPLREVTFDDWGACLRELEVLARMKHAGTLRLVGFHIPETVNCGPTILTPLMPNGTVADFRKSARGILIPGGTRRRSRFVSSALLRRWLTFTAKGFSTVTLRQRMFL